MLTYFVIIPILIATFLYLFSSAKTGRIIAIAVQALLFVFSFYLFLISRENEVITNIGNFDGLLGISLRADGLSAAFVLLTSFIFLIAAIYSFNEKNSRLFWFLLFIWESSLIGIFLTRDFFNIFVLLEVANVVVTIMIMYLRRSRSLYDGLIYLMANLVAVQFYLFGIGYLYRIAGAMDMEAVAYVISVFPREVWVLPYALIMTTVAFKCALLPLYSWLPKAHGTPGAPSTVSAILSGLHIKTGVYMFLRFQAVFGDVAVPQFFLSVGIITGVIGVIMALSQTDIKLILAYSTIAQIGLIIIGLGLDGQYSHIGSLYHIINHALFKSALFLAAGIITHVYHTRDITKISCVLKRSPAVGIASLLAIFGIAGVPLFNGSISKYFIMSGVTQPMFWVINIINLGTITVFIKFSSILFGNTHNLHKESHTSKTQIAAVTILGILCFAGGIFGAQFVSFFFGIPVNIDFLGYIEKVVIFALSVGIGYLIFKRFVMTSPILERVKKIDIGFRGICVCLGIFFAITLIITRTFGYPS